MRHNKLTLDNKNFTYGKVSARKYNKFEDNLDL